MSADTTSGRPIREADKDALCREGILIVAAPWG